MNREVKSQQEANLSVLKRQDASIVSVLATSGHVAVYRFDDDSKSWARREVEGSLFVVERDEPPKYRFVVMNRLSTENLNEDITPSVSVQLADTYLLYRKPNGEINGIWFYEESDREIIANKIEEIKQDLLKPQMLPPAVYSGQIPFSNPNFTQNNLNNYNTSQPINNFNSNPPNFNSAPPTQTNPVHPVHTEQQPQQVLQQPTVFQNVTPTSKNSSSQSSSSSLKLLSPSSLATLTNNVNNFSVPSSSTSSSSLFNTHTTFSRPVLTKPQLQQIILNLTQDERFMDLVYAEYLNLQH